MCTYVCSLYVAYIYIYIYIYTHTHTHTYIHTYIHTYWYACTVMCTHVCNLCVKHTCVNPDMHAQLHSRTHVYPDMHAQLQFNDIVRMIHYMNHTPNNNMNHTHNIIYKTTWNPRRKHTHTHTHTQYVHTDMYMCVCRSKHTHAKKANLNKIASHMCNGGFTAKSIPYLCMMVKKSIVNRLVSEYMIGTAENWMGPEQCGASSCRARPAVWVR